MQIISTSTDHTPYTAVFALDTPAYDHSGLSHLVEHMVFRGSDAFPASHELFIINSLLPATINATTENGCTFYYVEAQNETVFITLVDFLISGIFQSDYSESEFTLEKNGVVYRELLMYEAIPEYLHYSRAIRGSNSVDNVLNYGGFSDLITANNLQRLRDYKKLHYSPKQVRLFIKASVHLVNEVSDRLRGFASECSAPPKIKLESLTLPCQASTPDEVPVAHFFVHCDFFQSIKGSEQHIKAALNPEDILVIEQDINQQGLFAIRLISPTLDSAKNKFINTLNQLTIAKHPFSFNCVKQAGFVKETVIQYLQSKLNIPPSKALSIYLDSCELAITQKVIKIENPEISHTPSIKTSRIAKELESLLSIENIPMLPKLFDEFFTNGNCEGFTTCNSNWLLEVKTSLYSVLIDKIINPEFWLPRLCGECYAMGLGWRNNRLYIYGAQDINSDARKAILM